jgi:hypothetical protein
MSRLRASLMALIVLLLSLGVAQSAPSKSVTMQDLTVPQDRLPDGCSLRLIEPGWQAVSVTPAQSSRGIQFVGTITAWIRPQGVTVNPWTGTDRRILAELRRGVDGYDALPIPDAPPLTPSEASSMFAQFANGVQEGYAATYAQSGSRDLAVWAVRFGPAPAPERRLDLPGGRRSSQNISVVDIGSIRVALFGDASVCSTAIGTYLKSLGK